MAGSLNFSILGTKLSFTKLRQVFVKTSIFYHFNPECHIQIETDALEYVIAGVISQLILDDLGQ